MKRVNFCTALLWLGFCGLLMISRPVPVHASAATDYLHSTHTATVYVHGYNGGTYTTNDLIKAADKAGAAQKTVEATVSKTGKVIFTGKWPKDTINPIVQVVFKKNNAAPSRQTAWLYKVLADLKKTYGVTKYNGVGHSLGCNVLVNEALLHSHDTRLPKLNKLMTIAGPFNGVVGLGDHPDMNRLNSKEAPAIMNTTYLAMLRLRKHFPSNAKVLNVFGDLHNGTKTDHYVSVPSAKSLGYILRGVAKSYQELEVKGKNAEHSDLHDNATVSKAMIRFLWGK